MALWLFLLGEGLFLTFSLQTKVERAEKSPESSKLFLLSNFYSPLANRSEAKNVHT